MDRRPPSLGILTSGADAARLGSSANRSSVLANCGLGARPHSLLPRTPAQRTPDSRRRPRPARRDSRRTPRCASQRSSSAGNHAALHSVHCGTSATFSRGIGRVYDATRRSGLGTGRAPEACGGWGAAPTASRPTSAQEADGERVDLGGRARLGVRGAADWPVRGSSRTRPYTAGAGCRRISPRSVHKPGPKQRLGRQRDEPRTRFPPRFARYRHSPQNPVEVQVLSSAYVRRAGVPCG